MPHDVFIAHPTEHKAAAVALSDALRALGLSGFVDQQVAAGTRWQEALPAVQESCRATVVLIYEGLKPRPYLSHEIAVAIDMHDEGHVVLPVWIAGAPERAVRKMPPGLGGFQALDARVLGWNGVAGKIREALGGAAPTPVVSPAEKRSAPRRRAGEVVHEVEGLRFVYVPGGTFHMGRPDNPPAGSMDAAVTWDDEKPQHEVRLSPFALAVTPVTQAQYAAVMGANPSWFKDKPDGAARPVENVSWFDAVRFCNRLSEREGRSPAYTIGAGDRPEVTLVPGATGYRLPTEAQWEYACRAGSGTSYYAGDQEADLTRVGWYDQNSDGETHPVARKPANAWGLHDVHGNVWEWCWDWFDQTWYRGVQAPDSGWYRDLEPLDPTGPFHSFGRVLRGGSCRGSAHLCRSAYRKAGDPSSQIGDWGFRPALPVPAEPVDR